LTTTSRNIFLILLTVGPPPVNLNIYLALYTCLIQGTHKGSPYGNYV